MESVYEFIYAVKTLGSFSKAADYLHISQPALSIAVKKLEEELNQSIFDRRTKPAALTPAGQILFSYIEKVKLLEHNTKAELNELDSLNSGNLIIGGTQYFTAFIFPEIIFNYKKKYPNVKIDCVEASSVRLNDLLINNEIDLMFSVKNLDRNKFSLFRGLTDYLFIAVPKNLIMDLSIKKYGLTRQTIIEKQYNDLKAIPSLKDLGSMPFILLNKGNNLHDRSKMLFELEGIMPPVEMTLDQLTTAHYISKSGMGATFTTGRLIAQIDDNDNLVYLKYDHPLMIRNFNIVINKSRYISNIIDAFIKMF